MTDWRRYFGLCSVLMILLLSWGYALHLSGWLQAEYQGLSVRMHGRVTQEALFRAISENADKSILRVSAWTRNELATINNESLETAARVRRIAVYGDMHDVCPMELLYGGFPAMVDEAGCVIDVDTAWSLFHHKDVIGADVRIGGKPYIVRGIVRAKEAMILFRDEKAEYENLEIACSNMEEATSLVTTFLYRYGLAAEYTVVENGFYGRLATGLSGLPGWIIGAAILFALLKRAWKRRSIPLQFILLCIALAGTFYLLKWLLEFHLYWPDRFLPTRWSDFTFWPELIKAQTDYFESLSFLQPVPKDMQWFSAVRRLFVSLTVSCATAVHLLRTGKTRVGEQHFDYGSILCILLCAALSVAILYPLGIPFVPSKTYLFAAPIWWLFETSRKINFNDMQRLFTQ